MGYSLSQVFGKGGDLLAEKTVESILGRMSQFSLLGYINLALGYYSHEFGHNRTIRNHGDSTFKINLESWIQGVPGYEPIRRFESTTESFEDFATSGLSQESLNAAFIHSRTVDCLAFDEGIALLTRQFSPLTYDGYSSIAFNTANEGDVTDYIESLNLKGIELNREKFYIQGAIAALGSVKTWDSFRSIGNYLKNGERTTDTTKINFQDV